MRVPNKDDHIIEQNKTKITLCTHIEGAASASADPADILGAACDLCVDGGNQNGQGSQLQEHRPANIKHT